MTVTICREEGTGGVASPVRLRSLREGAGWPGSKREREGRGCLCQNWQTRCAAAQRWVSLLPHGMVRLTPLRHGSPGRCEAASPGRSRLAAGHRHREGNHRDERKHSSQGGAKLWPEKAAPMVGPYQTRRAPSRDVLRAPGSAGQGLTCRSILWRGWMASSRPSLHLFFFVLSPLF